MDPDSRSKRGRDRRDRESEMRPNKRNRDSSESPEPQREQQESGGGLREMGVDEMNSLRAKLGLKPLKMVDNKPRESERQFQQEEIPIQKIEQAVEVEEKIALYVDVSA